MRYVTVLGAGLLVGTALAVIIPEGVHALYLDEMSTRRMINASVCLYDRSSIQKPLPMRFTRHTK